ncbi:MAG: hypothetical protein GXP49_08080 [Deltaproteobacteria bacterium]|nr:hypothetical protein [Deltaproteobacteria bacterium]
MSCLICFNVEQNNDNMAKDVLAAFLTTLKKSVGCSAEASALSIAIISKVHAKNR